MAEDLNISGIGPQGIEPTKTGPSTGPLTGQSFREILENSIQEVNRLQAEADSAVNRLATGQTDNISEVFTAVQKAEFAFDLLMQIRNKLESAYDEIRQMRL